MMTARLRGAGPPRTGPSHRLGQPHTDRMDPQRQHVEVQLSRQNGQSSSRVTQTQRSSWSHLPRLRRRPRLGPSGDIRCQPASRSGGPPLPTSAPAARTLLRFSLSRSMTPSVSTSGSPKSLQAARISASVKIGTGSLFPQPQLGRALVIFIRIVAFLERGS